MGEGDRPYQGLYQIVFNGTATARIMLMPIPGQHPTIDDTTVYPEPRPIGTATMASNSKIVNAPTANFTAADNGGRIKFGVMDGIVASINSPSQVTLTGLNSGATVSGPGTVGPTPIFPSVLTIAGSYITVRDLHVTNSNPNRTGGRVSGVLVYQGTIGVEVINCVIDNTGGGLSKNDLAKNVKFYGNVLTENGWDDTNTGLKQGGTGHGIYAANNSDSDFADVSNNIMTLGFGYGLHAYSAGTGHLFNFHVQDNVFYENGEWTRTGSAWFAQTGRANPCPINGAGCEGGAAPNFFIGHRPVENFSMQGNFGFMREGRYGDNTQIGYLGNDNVSATITGNTLIGGANSIIKFPSLAVSGNTFVSNVSSLWWGRPLESTYNPAKTSINNNTYYFAPLAPGTCANPQFFLDDQPKSVADWQAFGFDRNSAIATCGKRPTGIQVKVIPNAYDSGRAHIVVVNYDRAATVQADLSQAGWKPGDPYTILNSQNYFGPPVTSGVYQGGAVSIRMDNLTVARPVGWNGPMVRSSGPDFGAFVLLKQ
jgi:catechol 2,3-dioxygenase-like lactoylglutathione lyase family enzyme